MDRKIALFGIIVLLALFPTPVRAQTPSFREWTEENFSQQGHIHKHTAGLEREQLRFYQWEDNTLLDLSETTFYALDDGPFKVDQLPKKYPDAAAMEALTEASFAEKYPVNIKGRGSRNILVSGLQVIGCQPRELPWRIMKGLYDGDGIRIEASGEMIVDHARIDNVEDGYSPRGDGYWILRNSRMEYIRDDFVENDGLLSGEIVDCLADGVFVFISARPGKDADPEELDKISPPVVKIRNTLVNISPMPFDGDMKGGKLRYINSDGNGCGMLFKWSRWGGTVDVADCIFRVDAMSINGPTPMKFPEGVYRNVTLVWLGEGEYPAELPDGVTLSRDAGVWNRARVAWLKRHPDTQRRELVLPPDAGKPEE